MKLSSLIKQIGDKIKDKVDKASLAEALGWYLFLSLLNGFLMFCLLMCWTKL